LGGPADPGRELKISRYVRAGGLLRAKFLHVRASGLLRGSFAARAELSLAQREASTVVARERFGLSLLTKQTRGWKGTAMHSNLVDVFKDALFWGIMAIGISPTVLAGALLVWLQ
jgi:hypothetical protein